MKDGERVCVSEMLQANPPNKGRGKHIGKIICQEKGESFIRRVHKSRKGSKRLHKEREWVCPHVRW